MVLLRREEETYLESSERCADCKHLEVFHLRVMDYERECVIPECPCNEQFRYARDNAIRVFRANGELQYIT